MSSSGLDIFKINDPKKLYLITLKLFNDGVFNCFLSAQQFTLLDLILNGIPDKEERLLIWDAFINSKLSLKFEETNQTPNPNSNSTTNSISTENPTIKKEPDTSIPESESEIYLKSGLRSSRRLCSTVRYLLYDKAVDYIYDKDLLSNLNSDNFFLGIQSVLQEESDDMEVDDNISTNATNENKPKKVRDEEDDYDDDDDDDEEDEEKEKTESTESGNDSSKDVDIISDGELQQKPKSITHQVEANGQITITIPTKIITAKPNFPTATEQLSSTQESVGQMIHPILGTASAIESNIERQNELKLVKNFNKIYHTFENDLANVVKRRKLERSDKQLEMIQGKKEDYEEEEEDDDGKHKVNKLMSLGGAANLSLKNLFSRIEENREKLQITDLELKNLIMDVRKNRSKWASYNKIGQEELYEACEKVIMELRGYTEHSTAFLNRVSKRDAPNYYQVIKKPMDLNTVLKKLKTFQYKNKTEFVDDLMLIWKNCLTYNSDPNHYIRVDALAMQKKTLTLVPLIPDITVRDRADVEKEAALEAAAEKQEEEAKPVSTRGVGSGNPSKKAAKKGRNNSIVEQEDEASNASGAPEQVAETASATPLPTEPVKVEGTPSGDVLSPSVGAPVISDATAAIINHSNLDGAATTDVNNSAAGTPGGASVPPEDDENEDEENADDAQVNGARIDEDDNMDEDDLEVQTWKTLTSNTRYKLCVQRSELLKDNKLQPNQEALLRDAVQMSNFNNYLDDKSGIVLHRNRKYFDENDDPYLMEYDISGGLPTVKYTGVDDHKYDTIQDKLIEQMMAEGKKLDELPPSRFMPTSKSSHLVIQENIKVMQDIRNICAKISIIRQMKTQQFIHHTQMVAPKIERIQEKDIEPLTKLPIYDQMTSEVSYSSLRRSVSQIAMANGFEATDPLCANILTQLAETYLSNLASSLKVHMESNSINKIPIKGHAPLTLADILLITLADNGIEKPDVLYAYAKEHLQKQRAKLLDLRSKLENFLKELLRPTFQDMSEKGFQDDSEQFMNGDFSNEIGEDFFGFRELGLDKEFGLLTSTIPLHLLHSRLNSSYSIANSDDKKVKFEDFDEVKFPRMTVGDISKEIGLIQHFLKSLVKKSEGNHLKTQKRNEEDEKLPDDKDELVLIEDEDLPTKQRNYRPRIPPTGKISGVKRKFIVNVFFLDKQDEERKEMEKLQKEEQQQKNAANAADSMAVDSEFGAEAVQDGSVDGSGKSPESDKGNDLMLEVIKDQENKEKNDSNVMLEEDSLFGDDSFNL